MRSPLPDFARRRVAITGGASGIGLALATRMAAQGAHIAICDLHADRLEDAATALRSAGAASLRTDALDVADLDALDRWIGDVVQSLGGIDVGWNNAGIMPRTAPLQDHDWRDYARVMDVNLHAVVRGSQGFLRVMAEQSGPALLLNTGSENSLFHAVPGGGPYVASKQAVRAITETLYQDAPAHIDVKLLCPGFVHTPLGPRAQMQHGMTLERFADIAFPMLTSDQFYLVSHGYNAVRAKERHAKLLSDIEAGAASAEETKRFDTYTLMGRPPFWETS